MTISYQKREFLLILKHLKFTGKQKQDLYFSKIYINFMLSIKSNKGSDDSDEMVNEKVNDNNI